MKVIALKDRDNYICEVSYKELAKLMNRYYTKNELPRMNGGEVINLDEGYNFSSEIRSACHSMTQAMERFETARKTLFTFSQAVLSTLPVPENTDAHP